MPKLNDYLGSIISSVSNARVMADIQTVKVAEDYAKHELLRHFAVPRMRIADVELTIPVAIESAEEELADSVDIIKNQQFNKVIYDEITKNLGRTSLPLKASREVRSLMSDNANQLELDINKQRKLTPVAQYSSHLAKEVTRIALENKLIKREQDAHEAQLSERIQQAAERLILSNTQKTRLGDMNVIAESHLLKEQKPESIVHIKMRITEDGMEWQQIEQSDGDVTRKLLPE
ncbi:hypothetical protein [Alteromonas halophila]|uniref:Uncharacterized protein n=1 Tax=Alteromonas halophila TaxID=516698 RepID=A0A918MZS2_9ALTE|nr:hypothetical protein [Alteromonas halophila]GGW86638.1 hypothetical protein GCM10007391_20430 [Alteromonas halophila]